MDILLDPIDSYRAWTGSELSQADDYANVLTESESAELLEASERLPQDPNEWILLGRDDLPLNALGERLRGMTREIESGRGFALMRGVNVDCPLDTIKRQYWILGVHLGKIVPQNSKGELMGSVTDKGSKYAEDVHARGYTSSDELTFHSDAGDAVSLLCVRPAPEGGENAIVSTMAIYNAVLKEKPHLLPTLYEGFRVYLREDGDGSVGDLKARAVSKRRYPVFSYYEGCLSGGVNIKSVRAVPMITGDPFSYQEQEAIDFVEEVANRRDMALNLRLGRGDLFVVNNYAVLHKRYRFVDDTDQNNRRLLLRFWINLHNGRRLAPDVEAATRVGFGGSPVMEAATT